MKNIEKRMLENCGTALLKRAVRTKFLPENCGKLGFTSMSIGIPEINVAWYENEYFKPLTKNEQTMLRMGIGAHELLHQVFTDFEYTEHVANSMKRAEAGIFMMFANTIEDPAIEYHAPCVMGGWLLDALKFTIRHIYEMSGGIDDAKNPFQQLINALIHFGDLGNVKGEFTFPEAFEYFKKVVPLYNKAILNPISKERIDIAKECMELTRPLWEEAVKEAEFFEELMKHLMDELKKSGAHAGKEMEKSMKAPASEISEKRSEIAKKIEDAEKSSKDKNEENNDGSSSDEKGSSDADDKDSDSKEKSDKEDKSGKDEKSSESEKSDETADSDSGSSSSESDSDSDTPDEKSDTSKSDSSSDKEILSELSVSPKEATRIAKETLEVSEDAMDSIKKRMEEEIKKEEKENSSDRTPRELPDFSISGVSYKSATCINCRPNVPVSAKGIYQQIVSMHKTEIEHLKKQLKKIFEADKESMSRSTSGNYNILRGSIGTSARIFDKRKEKGKTKDVAIFLLVDLSGSMSGRKVEQARITSVIFAEALTALNVPFYIMGFTADRGAEAVHIHYVDWSNKKSDRESIASMQAGGNNFDGYSIRYAGEVLKKRPENNKLLFVISDGEPACQKYRGGRDVGISDTANAIKEVKKSANTFGIAFGTGVNPTLMKGMYGTDFIHCPEISLLSGILTKKLEKMVKKGK